MDSLITDTTENINNISENIFNFTVNALNNASLKSMNLTDNSLIINNTTYNSSSVLFDEFKQCYYQLAYKSLSQLGLLFYIHNPYDHQYQSANQVPNYEIFVSEKSSFKINF